METVFKVGMDVYDQLFYPNKKGVVKRIYNDEPDIDFPIEVEFEEKIESYSLKGSCNYFGIITLSTSPYTLQGFEQKAPVPTFEEVWDEVERIYEPKSEYDKDEYKGYPSQKLADAAEALRRLLFLRDYYNEGWQPNWEDDEWKYFIEYYRGELEVSRTCGNSRVLHFKSRDIAKRFLKEQKELLEIAKPLL